MPESKSQETPVVMASPTKVAGEVSNSPKSSPSKKDIDIATQALNHFAQGKRHLLVNDITLAVNSLQEACRLLAEHYGETAQECADAYFYYGKALLELARIESGVLGNALDGVPEGDDENNSQVEDPEKMTEEEVDMVTELVDEALEENFQHHEKKSHAANGISNGKDDTDGNAASRTNGTNGESNVKESESFDKKTEDSSEVKIEEAKMECDDSAKTDKDKMEATIENGEQKENGHESEKESPKKVESDTPKETNEQKDVEEKNKESAEEEEEDDEEADGEEGDEGEETQEESAEAAEESGEKTESEEDDVDNLQLSWEMLELSKVIYTKSLEDKSDDNTTSLKLAQVYLKLGEVGLESENYTQSIEDFQECLKIQTKELAADDRRLAETNYQIGIAYSLSDDFDKAIGSFESAVNVVEKRIDNLKKIKEKKASWTEEQKLKDDQEKKDPFYTEQGEIDELLKLLPDIQEKVVDMKEMKKDSKEKLQKFKETAFASMLGGAKNGTASTSAFSSNEESSSFSAADSTDKPTSNITHLIRKKRKPEDEVEKEVKRPKEDADAPTDSTTTTNGHKDKEDFPVKQNDAATATAES